MSWVPREALLADGVTLHPFWLAKALQRGGGGTTAAQEAPGRVLRGGAGTSPPPPDDLGREVTEEFLAAMLRLGKVLRPRVRQREQQEADRGRD